MVPLIILGSLANAAAYKVTSHRYWKWSGLLIFLIAPYTKILMSGDIETLQTVDASQAAAPGIRFCSLTTIMSDL